MVDVLEEGADAIVRSPKKKGINVFAHQNDFAFWHEPCGRSSKPKPEMIRKQFYDALQSENNKLYGLWSALGVDHISEMRILLIDARASAFVMHTDIGHASTDLLGTGLVFHLNIALSEDYLPGEKSYRLYEDSGANAGKSSTSTFSDHLHGSDPGKWRQNYLFGDDRIAIDYGAKVGGQRINTKVNLWKLGRDESDDDILTVVENT
jgi:hypothetical protein